MISVQGKRSSNTDSYQLQGVNVTEFSPVEYGDRLLERAGLTSLEARKNAFLSDPGSTVTVQRADDSSGSLLTNASSGWLVVESSGDNYRGTLFTTMAGAVAQVWSILSLQQELSVQDAATVSSTQSSAPPASALTLQVSVSLGMKSVVLANLQGT